jgi:tRNA acetyltransferase TAN1
MDFNLIITTFRNREFEAAAESVQLIKDFIGLKPKIEETGIKGLLVAYVECNPIRIIDVFKDHILREPWLFRYILRIIPIEINCETNLEDIVSNTLKLSYKIPKISSFKISIEKRFCELKSSVLISNIASNIGIKVNLNCPEWIILVEILGKKTGLSVLKPDYILSILKVKRDF